MTRDNFDMAMTTMFQDDWCNQSPTDKDKIFGTVMEIWLNLELTNPTDENEETLANYHALSQMDDKTRLRYRCYLAEAGIEYTPEQVEMLAVAIEYAFETYNESME